MKKLFLLVSVLLNIILITVTLTGRFSYSSQHLEYCREELKETLYLLDLANTVFEQKSPQMDAGNPYFYKLRRLGDKPEFIFEMNPALDVISHSSDYEFYLKIDSNEFIKSIGWYKP